jgi:hypothetical protein
MSTGERVGKGNEGSLYTSKISVTLSIITECKDPRAESTSTKFSD